MLYSVSLLNQVSYYIASSYDYIPLYFESYAGNIHDSKTFESIIGNTPVSMILLTLDITFSIRFMNFNLFLFSRDCEWYRIIL